MGRWVFGFLAGALMLAVTLFIASAVFSSIALSIWDTWDGAGWWTVPVVLALPVVGLAFWVSGR